VSRRLGGLTSGEVARRLSADGPNLVPTARRTRLAERVLSQLRDPLVMVLLVAAVLTIATGDWTDAGVVLLVIVVNTAAGVTQEVRADQAIAALGALRAPEARVVRDGRERAVPARDVVVGDLLVLTEGAIVPADAVVVEAAGLTRRSAWPWRLCPSRCRRSSRSRSARAGWPLAMLWSGACRRSRLWGRSPSSRRTRPALSPRAR